MLIASNTLTNALIWTGSDADGGGASSGWVLGNTGDGGVVVLGGNFMTAAGWVNLTNSFSYSESQMYAISSVLTVAAAVPEPSSGLLALMGVSAGLGLASYRKCRGQWRQDPVGPAGVPTQKGPSPSTARNAGFSPDPRKRLFGQRCHQHRTMRTKSASR